MRGPACLNLAADLVKEGPDQDPGTAARLFEAACDAGAYQGCFRLAVLHAKGRSGAVEDSRANVF